LAARAMPPCAPPPRKLRLQHSIASWNSDDNDTR
jgi:hypothetical protein